MKGIKWKEPKFSGDFPSSKVKMWDTWRQKCRQGEGICPRKQNNHYL